MLIHLVRHPAPAIEPGRCYGRLDIDLHADGLADLPRLAGSLPRWSVWTSPALRCRRLAGLLSATPIVDDRLHELDFGDWEGRRWDEIPPSAIDAWAADPLGFAPPGGESGAALVSRVGAVCLTIRRAGRDCLVVSHGGPLRLMPALLRGERPDLLATPPPMGGAVQVEAMAVSAAHSATTAQPPSTSPV